MFPIYRNQQTRPPPSLTADKNTPKHSADHPATMPTSPQKLRELYEMLYHETGLDMTKLRRNVSVPQLYEEALQFEEGSAITDTGALVTSSGHKTGRSPLDKRVVDEPTTTKDIWWGPVNIPMDEHTFMVNHERAVDYLKTRKRIYVFDGFAGWHPEHRLKVRIICSRAYHALFMRNMLIRPTDDELENFGKPDFTIFNAGEFPANRYTSGMTSPTSVDINFKRNEMVILGTQYAGEMKKGVFTVMHYFMPKKGLLSLHSSANCSKTDPTDVTLFFGLSGTGKTTLSADINRCLIGDDEHVWGDSGIFNIEGGCYAKCIGLSKEKEPEIYDAIRFGSVLENVVYDPQTRAVNYDDSTITENTRCAYPIEYIPNALIPCIAGHPKNIIMLTFDAFGVLPPVSKLTSAQAMYHFISGYTAKVAGTEDGVSKPSATFSACFGQPFLIWHPTVYAKMLAERMHQHKADAWLINTGWIGGCIGSEKGHRISLKYTRAILDAIHSGELAKSEDELWQVFNLRVPMKCTGVPCEILHPERAWDDLKAYQASRQELARLFTANFEQYAAHADPKVLASGPRAS